MRKQKKVNLKQEIITNYFLENVDMTSEEVPGWLLALNNGIADPELFENADNFEREDVIDLLNNSLTAVWLYQTVENDLGEVAFESNTYEAMRRTYIETVQQRLDTVYDLRRTPMPDIKIKPFLIFWIGDVVINISKLEKSREQLLKSEVMQCREWANSTKQLPN